MFFLQGMRMKDSIVWLGHASFRIDGPPVIYIDPWRVPRTRQPADIILITHDHYDHCSPADVEKLRGPETMVIGNAMAAAVINDVTVLRPWQTINVGRASIKSVPAYNSHHPQSFDGLGYIISLNHYDIYYAGDTDLIPEMDRIRPDIAILPIGGRQTMNAVQAAEAVRRLRPRWVIPSHWGSPAEGGTKVDVRSFTENVGDAADVILPQAPHP
jgi:L-ascorbate metabolism protein UlaG (beta-lactamase superfamily)